MLTVNTGIDVDFEDSLEPLIHWGSTLQLTRNLRDRGRQHLERFGRRFRGYGTIPACDVSPMPDATRTHSQIRNIERTDCNNVTGRACQKQWRKRAVRHWRAVPKIGNPDPTETVSLVKSDR
jgi:hypothetical protein